MSAQLNSFPKITGERPAHVQTVLAGGIYGYLLGECLSLYQSDARLVERKYGIPPETQLALGYRSAPESLRFFPEVKDDGVSQWLDSLSDDEFLDWFTYSKQPLYTYVRPDGPAQEHNLHLNLIEQGMAERFGEVRGIPGLYVDERLHVKMPRRGLIVPCRVDSIIRAVLVYPRIGEDKTFWLSSNNLNGGAKATASLHVANQERGYQEHIAVIVSHTMEADALAWEMGECVVAVNGLSPLRVLRELRLVFPDLRGCMVAPALPENLSRTLRENGLRVRVSESEGSDE